jgi:hypothetical protein
MTTMFFHTPMSFDGKLRPRPTRFAKSKPTHSELLRELNEKNREIWARGAELDEELINDEQPVKKSHEELLAEMNKRNREFWARGGRR